MLMHAEDVTFHIVSPSDNKPIHTLKLQASLLSEPGAGAGAAEPGREPSAEHPLTRFALWLRGTRQSSSPLYAYPWPGLWSAIAPWYVVRGGVTTESRLARRPPLLAPHPRPSPCHCQLCLCRPPAAGCQLCRARGWKASSRSDLEAPSTVTVTVTCRQWWQRQTASSDCCGPVLC
jgi:hypothetical protein